jgi:hypothetical protein
LSAVSFISHFYYADKLSRAVFDEDLSRIGAFDRFQSDNAIGATGNAAEKIASDLKSYSELTVRGRDVEAQANYGILFLIAAILALAASSLLRISGNLEVAMRLYDANN